MDDARTNLVWSLLPDRAVKLGLILILMVACGGRDRRDSPDDRVPAESKSTPLGAAHVAPDRAVGDGFNAGTLTVESAILASVLAGGTRLITTGTLIATENERRWSPEPSDRMIVQHSDRRYELRIDALDGDFTNSNAFFSGNHVLDASARTDGADLTAHSERSGTMRRTSVRGTTTIESRVHTVDLHSDGTEYFENDSTGSEYRQQHRLLGTIDFDGAHLDVDEGWDFVLVTTTGSGAATVTSAVRTISSRLEAGGHRYEWKDARLQKAFRDGRPNEVDSFWGANGGVLRDGGAFAQYHLEHDLVTGDAGFLKFQLVLPTQTIDVESWQVR